MLSWWFQKRWEKSFLMQYSDFLPIRKLSILTWNYSVDPLKFPNQNGSIFFLNIYSYVLNSIPVPGWILFPRHPHFLQKRQVILSELLSLGNNWRSFCILSFSPVYSFPRSLLFCLSCFNHCIGMGERFAWTFFLRGELEESINFVRCAGTQKEGPVSGAAPLLCPFLSR